MSTDSYEPTEAAATPHPPQPESPQPESPPTESPQAEAEPATPYPLTATEDVLRGLIFAFGGVLAGVVATVVIWRFGYIASITSFVMAALAAFLYAKGAGASPRKGALPLVLLILVGVVASFFAVVASDAWDAYDKVVGSGAISRFGFLRTVMFDPEVLKSYGKDMAMFALFAVLGMFGIIRQLAGGRDSAG